MEWVLWMVVVIVAGLAAVAGSGRFGSMPEPVRDVPIPQLPDGDLTGDDVRRLQFATVVRGYSMAQVDALLDRLARQLDAASDDPEPPTLVPSAIMEPDDAPAGAIPSERNRGTDGSHEATNG